MAPDHDWSSHQRPHQLLHLQEQLKKLHSRLGEEAKDDDPILAEIERITSWLELFNSLCKGLVKMNRILEKSSECHRKLHLLVAQGSSGHRTRSDCERRSNADLIGNARHSSPAHVSLPSLSSAMSCNVLQPSHVYRPVIPVSAKAMTDGLAARVSAVLRRTALSNGSEDGPLDEQEIVSDGTAGAASSSSCSTMSSNRSSLKSSDASVRVRRDNKPLPVTEKNGLPARRKHERGETERKSTSPNIRVHQRTHSSASTNDRLTREMRLRQAQIADTQILTEFSSSTNVLPERQSFARDVVRLKDRSPESCRQPASWFIGINGCVASKSLQQAFDEKCADLKAKSMKRSELIRGRGEVRRMAHEALIEDRDGQQGWAYRLLQHEPRPLTRTIPTPRSVPVRRVFTHREMRSQTERIYRNLPEVRQREKDARKEVLKQTHDIMKHVFTNKVQRENLKGRVHFPITQNFVCY